MSIKFIPLKVADIVRETPDANTVVFEKPSGDSFDYQPGQYLTLKFDVNGASVRRAYSLCSSPITDSQLAVTVKRVENGIVSNHIADNLKAGDSVEVLPPMGNFKVNLSSSNSHHYILLGGGSGITPLMSIIKSVLQVEPNSKLSLIYSNRDEASIIFKDSLAELSAANPGRLKIIYSIDQASPTWSGMVGLPTRQVLLGVLNDIAGSDSLPKTFWLCGPQGMMAEAEAAISFLGVQKNDIKKESFAAKLADPDAPAKQPAAEGKAGDYTIKVTLDGETQEVFVKQNQTILEAVIDKGMDPPYACQMGVCCTCRALVSAGSVDMEEDEGLSDAEIEEGYVLTCQSHPMTPDVELEYQ